MKMTIEETKTQLVMQKSYALGKDYRALENALDIIRKYEKIQEIISADLEYLHPFDRNKCIVVSIKEVLEDGQNTIKD